MRTKFTRFWETHVQLQIKINTVTVVKILMVVFSLFCLLLTDHRSHRDVKVKDGRDNFEYLFFGKFSVTNSGGNVSSSILIKVMPTNDGNGP